MRQSPHRKKMLSRTETGRKKRDKPLPSLVLFFFLLFLLAPAVIPLQQVERTRLDLPEAAAGIVAEHAKHQLRRTPDQPAGTGRP